MLLFITHMIHLCQINQASCRMHYGSYLLLVTHLLQLPFSIPSTRTSSSKMNSSEISLQCNTNRTSPPAKEFTQMCLPLWRKLNEMRHWQTSKLVCTLPLDLGKVFPHSTPQLTFHFCTINVWTTRFRKFLPAVKLQ